MSDTRIGAISVDVNLVLANLEKGLKQAASSLKGAEKFFKDAGTNLSTALTAPLAGIGGFAIKAAIDYDKAFATIRRKTGETGAQLDSLKKSFSNLFAGGDDSAQEVAAALTKVRIATGESGEGLESLAGTILDLADVTEEDFNSVLDSSTGLLKSWKIANDDAAGSLDFVFKVTQRYGIGLSELNGQLTSLGPSLRALGFSFEESAVLLGEFSKQGLNSERVIAGFQKVIPKLIEANVPLKQGFEAITAQIGQMGGDTQKAEAILNSFGKKSIPELTQALNISQGAIKGAVDEISKAPESISKAAKESETFGQKLATAGNALTAALEPIGSILLDKVATAFEAVRPKLGEFADLLRTMNPDTLQTAVNIGLFAAALGPLSLAISFVAKTMKDLVLTMRTVAIFFSKASPLVLGIAGITGVLVASGIAWVVWGNQIREVLSRVSGYVDAFIKKFTVEFPRIAEVARRVAEGVTTAFGAIVRTLKIPFDGFPSIFKSADSQQGSQQLGAISNLVDGAKSKFEELKNTLGTGLQAASTAVGLSLKGVGTDTKAAGDQAALTANQLKGLNGILAGKDDSVKKKADEAAEAVKSLTEQLNQLNAQSEADSLRDQLRAALDAGQFDLARSFVPELQRAIANATLVGMQDSIDKGGAKAKALAETIANTEGQSAVAGITENINKEQAEALKKAHIDAVRAWREAFAAGLKSTAFDLKDIMEDVAVGFGSEMATALGLSPGTSAFSSEGRQQAFGELGKLAGEGLAQFFGGEQANPDFIGPQQPSGLSAIAGQKTMDALSGAVAQLPGIISQFSQAAKQGSDARAAVEAGAALAGAIIGGAYFGQAGAIVGTVIGNVVGKGINEVFAIGKRDAEAQARIDLTGALEELTGTIQFFNSQGKLVSTNNILSGNDTVDFGNQEQGFAQGAIDAFGNRAVNAFAGVGNAFEEILGIAEDVGTQTGISILTQFEGDIEGLKALVDVAKLTYDDFVNALVEAGKRGEASWLEIVSQIRDGNAAFVDGLEGTGKFAQAFENLLNSAGKGQISLNQVKNIAIEAQEAGVTTLEALAQKLIETGQFTQTEIDGLFASFQQNGIKNLADITKLTDLGLANIVAGLDAFLQDNGGKWRAAAEDIQSYSDNLDKLNGKNVDITLNVKTKFDSNTEDAIDQGIVDNKDIALNTSQTVQRKFASGAILKGPTFVAPGSLAGEAGPEGVLPLTNINGKLGVYSKSDGNLGGMVVNVDARGAARGVEQDIIMALEHMERSILQQAVSAAVDAAQRGSVGGFY